MAAIEPLSPTSAILNHARSAAFALFLMQISARSVLNAGTAREFALNAAFAKTARAETSSLFSPFKALLAAAFLGKTFFKFPGEAAAAPVGARVAAL